MSHFICILSSDRAMDPSRTHRPVAIRADFITGISPLPSGGGTLQFCPQTPLFCGGRSSITLSESGAARMAEALCAPCRSPDFVGLEPISGLPLVVATSRILGLTTSAVRHDGQVTCGLRLALPGDRADAFSELEIPGTVEDVCAALNGQR